MDLRLSADYSRCVMPWLRTAIKTLRVLAALLLNALRRIPKQRDHLGRAAVSGMLFGWLKDVEDGEFETDIISLKLTGYFNRNFEGQGRLTWIKEGVKIDAVTDGSALLWPVFGQPPVAPGKLLPSDYYLQLEGKTFD